MRSEVAIVGAGPAGLWAADRLVAAGVKRITVFDRMPAPGRKFLMAGRGGLNLTHSEPLAHLLTRYEGAESWLAPMLRQHNPEALRAWVEELGQATFVGTSGRVFPRAMKASPLLRAWLRRLTDRGVVFRFRHDWKGFDGADGLIFKNQDGDVTCRYGAAILALGGASWPRLGSNGSWVQPLCAAGIAVTPLEPSNCGVTVHWSNHLVERFAGEPLKRIEASIGGRAVRGEALLTRYGLEGGVIYALSQAIRTKLNAGSARLVLDLRPDLSADDLAARLAAAPAKQSLATRLVKAAKLSAAAIAVLRDSCGNALPREPSDLAALIKSVALPIDGLSGFEKAISSAGGITNSALDEQLMLRARPGTFVAGEMIDWDAPTGGYLLQATFATARRAADGVLAWLSAHGDGNNADDLPDTQ